MNFQPFYIVQINFVLKLLQKQNKIIAETHYASTIQQLQTATIYCLICIIASQMQARVLRRGHHKKEKELVLSI